MSARLRIHPRALCLPLLLWGCSSASPGARDAAREPDPLDAGRDDARPARDAARDAARDVAAGDAATDAEPPDAADAGDACIGSVAVFGGMVAGASTIAFGATLDRGGSWLVSSLPSNLASPPAIVPFAGGFLAVFVDASGALESSIFTWSWSSPAEVAGRMAIGAPSLAVVGTSLHLVYQGDDSKFVHGVYTAGVGWDSADDPIGGVSKQGFGPSPPVAAGVDDTLAIAYAGEDGSLYDETWMTGTWQPDTEHPMTDVGALAPAIVALNGGSSDTLVVYADPGGTLYSTSRSSGAWSDPAVIDATAFTHASPSLVALSGGRAMMTYLGTNGLPYDCLYDPTATPAWTSPSAMGTSTAELYSPPSVANGVCGDDVVAVLTEPGGVTALRYAGGAWLPPTILPGTSGMTFASVASHP
jgi:hypothetical protein